MNAPDIDLDELRKLKEANFQDRLEFIKKYAQWQKSKPNKKWSLSQKKIIG